MTQIITTFTQLTGETLLAVTAASGLTYTCPASTMMTSGEVTLTAPFGTINER